MMRVPTYDGKEEPKDQWQKYLDEGKITEPVNGSRSEREPEFIPSAREVRLHEENCGPRRVEATKVMAPFYPPRPIEEGKLPLRVIAARLKPRWMHAYLLSSHCSVSSPRSEARLVALAKSRFPGNGEIPYLDLCRQVEIERRCRKTAIRLWQIKVMDFKIIPALRGALLSGLFKITGYLTGNLVEIPIQTMLVSSIDIFNNVIEIPGGLRWLGVVVEKVQVSDTQESMPKVGAVDQDSPGDRAKPVPPPRKRGNTPFNDADTVSRAKSLLESGGAKSARLAASLAVKYEVDSGVMLKGASKEAWIERIRKAIPHRGKS